MDPPRAILVTILGCHPARVKAQVREVGTLLLLLLPGLGGIEAGPAVEDQRAAAGADTGAEYQNITTILAVKLTERSTLIGQARSTL